jgi:hypothetical protein
MSVAGASAELKAERQAVAGWVGALLGLGRAARVSVHGPQQEGLRRRRSRNEDFQAVRRLRRLD